MYLYYRPQQYETDEFKAEHDNKKNTLCWLCINTVYAN